MGRGCWTCPSPLRSPNWLGRPRAIGAHGFFLLRLMSPLPTGQCGSFSAYSSVISTVCLVIVRGH